MNLTNLKQQGIERMLMLALDVMMTLTRILLKRAEDHYVDLKDNHTDIQP